MIHGGNAIVYVSDMERAIRFYTDALGLPLTNRFGNHWATVQAGKNLVIGIHPWNPAHPVPGTKGAIGLGLVVSRDMPIEDLAARLRSRGVEVSDVLDTDAGKFISFADPDGNPIYVGDWDPEFDYPSGESVEQRLARQEEEAAAGHAKG
jgi:catechol 2,3-dioxygenase-like lactoylglutathione lyase family enzyme